VADDKRGQDVIASVQSEIGRFRESRASARRLRAALLAPLKDFLVSTRWFRSVAIDDRMPKHVVLRAEISDHWALLAIAGPAKPRQAKTEPKMIEVLLRLEGDPNPGGLDEYEGVTHFVPVDSREIDHYWNTLGAMSQRLAQLLVIAEESDGMGSEPTLRSMDNDEDEDAR
jgi:hypothetical protein